MMDIISIAAVCTVQEWIQAGWHTCTFNPVVNSVGESVFGLFVGGGTIYGLYQATGSSIVAAVVLMLLSGIAIPVLPPGLRGVAWTVAFLGTAAALVTVGHRYFLSGATQTP